MRILNWLRSVLEGQRIRRRLRIFSRRLSDLDVYRKHCKRELDARKRELDSIREDLVQSENRLRETVEEALAVQRRYEEQLEMAKSQVKIYEEVTIPTMVQQMRSVFEMWKAQTDIQVRKQVMSQIPSGDETE